MFHTGHTVFDQQEELMKWPGSLHQAGVFFSDQAAKTESLLEIAVVSSSNTKALVRHNKASILMIHRWLHLKLTDIFFFSVSGLFTAEYFCPCHVLTFFIFYTENISIHSVARVIYRTRCLPHLSSLWVQINPPRGSGRTGNEKGRGRRVLRTRVTRLTHSPHSAASNVISWKGGFAQLLGSLLQARLWRGCIFIDCWSAACILMHVLCNRKERDEGGESARD